MLYNKTGAAFEVDHEIGETAYVRPMVKVVMQSTNYSGDDFHEETDYEAADYLIAVDRASLFGSPPVEQVNADIAAKRAEMESLRSEAAKELRRISRDRAEADNALAEAKRQFNEWMSKHRVMVDLGKLLDGKVLYPLTFRLNHYHKAPEIPRIPDMRNASLLHLTSGNFESGKPWVAKGYASDPYGSPFRFFDTEEDRSEVIASEFEAACAHFRKRPNFDTTSYTAETTLHYGTLLKWMETHPALSIPEDIQEMKAEHDVEVSHKHREKLAAELADLERKSTAHAETAS